MGTKRRSTESRVSSPLTSRCFRVYIWEYVPEGAVFASKEARLATGELLKVIGDDTYEIVQTGLVISRDR
jgi:hypothetical protein